ncbi:tRNA methyltransferase 10 homolog A isoform X2 [Hydra vulgaris]|uniref:tRNA (guanine(9)-N(1))-methyltransferase n=1 Tax=Hydra vulgaris TaxID=6087 RepID=A0ABM4CDV4_HYDVU
MSEEAQDKPVLSNFELEKSVIHSSWKDHTKNVPIETNLINLSKNQQKKLLKRELYLSRRHEKRKEERLRKKQNRIDLKAAGLPLPKRIKNKISKRKELSNQKIVIDLNFVDFMTETDLRMLLKQIRTCYAENRKLKNPLQLHLTSFHGKIKQFFSSIQPGCLNWLLEFHENTYLEEFKKEDIVYLTADSENVLHSLDDTKVYIIGGLVDHNHQKGLCHKLALSYSISHACLPINEYVKLNSRKVLTVNHVFEILLKYVELQDWKDAFFHVLPKRKGIDELDGLNSLQDNEVELKDKDIS